jgi:hypothetical protein
MEEPSSQREDAVPLDGSAFLRLPHWRRVALLARMALRLVPVFEPAGDRPEAAVLAYLGGAALAARASRDGKPAAADLLEPALKLLRASPASLATEAASVARIAQAAALGARSPGLQLGPGLLTIPGGFAEADEALRQDFAALRALGPASGIAPEEWWERPLWPDPRGEWRRALPRWRQLLGQLNLPSLYESYLNLAVSPASDGRGLEGLIGIWSAHLAAQGHPTPSAPLSPPPPVGRPRLQMLADRALDDDLGDRLDFKPYADAIAGLIDNPETGTPLTIAIHGPWGAGKSTLAGMIKRRLEKKPAAAGNEPHVTCWFNAWMHDDATDLAAAFAAEVARTADRLRPLWRRLLRPLPSAIRPPGERLRRRAAFWGSVVVTAAAVTVLRKSHQLEQVQHLINQLLKAFGVKAAELPDYVQDGAFFSLLTGLLLLIPHLTTVARSVSEFVRDPKAPASTGSMDRVRTQLGNLIQEATPPNSRFVVFVDDLERCRPPRSVDVLEVVNQLLCHADVVTVVMADMTAVAACAEIKYEKLASLYSPEEGGPIQGRSGCTYGRLYLQKIIQLQFNLPVLRPEKIRRFLDDLAEIANAAAPAAGTSPPSPARAVSPQRPSLLGTLRRGWQSPYLEGVRQAVVRKPWLSAVAATPRECLLLPTYCLGLWGSRLAYPPSAQRIQAKPGSAANLWQLAREIADGFYRPFLIAALCSWPRSFLASPWIEVPPARLAFLLRASAALAVLFTLLRGLLVKRRVKDALSHPGRTPPVLLRWSRWLVAGGLTLCATGAAWLAPLAGSSPGILAGGYLATAAACTGLTALFAWLEARAQRREDLKEMRRARELTWANIRNGILEQAELAKALGDVHLLTGQEDLIAEGLRLHLFNESALLSEAEAEVMPFLPPLPRSAKRILNNLRLMLFIASARQAFGGVPEISARHFGKWIVLQERWPEVARSVMDSPGEMAELERLAAKPKEFVKRVKGFAPWCSQDPDLRDFCAAETKLAGVIERLLHFDAGTSSSQAPPALGQ